MLNKVLKDVLVCTWCLGPLDEGAGALTCSRCRAVYAIEEGIPNMLLDSARLHCPVCRRELKKGEGVATCEACGRQFSMTERLPAQILEQKAEAVRRKT